MSHQAVGYDSINSFHTTVHHLYLLKICFLMLSGYIEKTCRKIGLTRFIQLVKTYLRGCHFYDHLCLSLKFPHMLFKEIFFSIWIFFNEHWRFTGQQGKGELDSKLESLVSERNSLTTKLRVTGWALFYYGFIKRSSQSHIRLRLAVIPKS